MYLLRKDRYEELRGKIREIRSRYPMKMFDIQFEFERLKREMLANAVPVQPGELTTGRKYGILEFSPRATAFVGGVGRELRNHGDIYITIWKWSGSDEWNWRPCFFCENAWGEIHEKFTNQIDLLIEFL